MGAQYGSCALTGRNVLASCEPMRRTPYRLHLEDSRQVVDDRRPVCVVVGHLAFAEQQVAGIGSHGVPGLARHVLLDQFDQVAVAVRESHQRVQPVVCIDESRIGPQQRLQCVTVQATPGIDRGRDPSEPRMEPRQRWFAPAAQMWAPMACGGSV